MSNRMDIHLQGLATRLSRRAPTPMRDALLDLVDATRKHGDALDAHTAAKFVELAFRGRMI